MIVVPWTNVGTRKDSFSIFFSILSILFGKNRFYLWHPTNKLKFYAHCSHMEHQLSTLRCFKQEMDKSAKNHERKMSFHTPHKWIEKTSQRTNNGNMLRFQKHLSVSYVWIAYKKCVDPFMGSFQPFYANFFLLFHFINFIWKTSSYAYLVFILKCVSHMTA